MHYKYISYILYNGGQMSNAKQSTNIIVNNLLSIMKQKGIRQLDLARYLDVNPNVITAWKTGRTKSYMNYMDRITKYLDVTEEEILHPEISGTGDKYLTPDLQQMVFEYNQIGIEAQQTICALIHQIYTDKIALQNLTS